MKKPQPVSVTTTPVRQISRKFRAYIMQRIATTCALLTDGTSIEAGTLAAINAYISCAAVPTATAPKELILIFTLLRPEIDRAIERSAKARTRKRRPHTATVKDVKDNASAAQDTEAGKPRPFNPNGPLIIPDSRLPLAPALHTALSIAINPDEIPDEIIDGYIEKMPVINRRMRRLIMKGRDKR